MAAVVALCRDGKEHAMPFDGEVIEGRYVPKELYVWEPPPKEKHFWHIEPGDSSARQVLKHA